MNIIYRLVFPVLLIFSVNDALARDSYPFDKGSPYLRWAQDAQPEAQCGQPKETLMDIEGNQVRYLESGSGPAVVLIHGNAGSGDDFNFKRLGLICRDYRVIAIDRVGHGKSDRPGDAEATLQFQTHFLHTTFAKLGITRPVIVGHSWGGSLALSYAVEYPQDVSAIVLIAPAAYPDGSGDEFLRALIKTPVIGDVSLTLGRLVIGKHLLKKELALAFYPETVPDEYLQHASSAWLHHKQLKAFIEDEYSLNKDLARISKHYSEIRIPVIIVTGDKDKVVIAKENAHRLKTTIAQARLIELKDTGHQILQTHPESVEAALKLVLNSTARLRETMPGSIPEYR